MNTNQLNKKLEYMKDCTWQYAKQIHFVKKFSIDEEKQTFTIETNLNSFTRKFESADEFLKYWVPFKEVVNQPPVVITTPTTSNDEVRNQVSLFNEQDKALADEMIDILRDNIKKVQENPGYVKQAQTINNNVNAIINVVRTKMDFMKQTKGR